MSRWGGAEDEDPEPYGMPDVQTLVDYWSMAENLGYDLDDAQVRYPADLLAAHDEATVAMEQPGPRLVWRPCSGCGGACWPGGALRRTAC